MLDSLIRWSLANRTLVLAVSGGVLAWGGFAVSQLPVEVLPDLTAPTVSVITEHPGLAPVDMERLVTFPVETALNGAPGLRRVRSATAAGVSVVWAEFDWGEDTYLTRQLVAERLGLATKSLPPTASPPALGPTTSIMGEILFIALTSDRHDDVELRTVADTVIRRSLLAVPGVAQVTPLGGGRKQYQVLLAPDRLKSYGVSLREVEAALAAGSSNTSAGFQAHLGHEHLLRGVGRFVGWQQIRDAVVRSSNVVPIQVGDLGEVRIDAAQRRGAAALNGEAAVIVGIRKQPATNTLALTERVEARLRALEPALPQGMRVHGGVLRQADFVQTAISNLEEALGIGGLLVVVVVIVFLGSWRASAIALFAIPFSLGATFVGLKALGLSINGMTLGGIAIAIGALVDDALIDVENVVRRLRQNAARPLENRLPTLQVVFRASSEIRGSIVFATLIVVLVFIPLFALENIEGMLLRPLGVAYIVAILASLLVALTVTPALCSVLLPRSRSISQVGEWAVVGWLRRLYEPILRWGLDHAAVVLSVALLLVAAALAGLNDVGRRFLPELNEGSLTISAATVPGTSLQDSDRLGAALERILLSVPGVVSTGRRTGRAESDEHLQGVESSEIDVRLDLRNRSKEEVVAEIRDRASLIPGTNVNIGQPISHRIDHMLSGTRASVAVKIFGGELDVLRALAEQVQAAMSSIPSVIDLASDRQADVPVLTVRFRRDDLARYGVPAGQAADALRTVFLGNEVGAVFEGDVPVPVVVRYAGASGGQIEPIRQTLIDTPSGARVPLSAVADIREDRSPNMVTREDVQRKIVVSCNVAGDDLRGAVTQIQQAVAASVVLPQGYRIEYGGQFESEARATQRMLLLGALAIGGILVLLVTALESVADALIVMCNLPLALVGGVAGVYAGGGVLSVASLIGFITLFGIAVRNGIMLLAHIRRLMAEEGIEDLRQAVVRGSSERLAPILMTAVSTGIALFPIALGLGKTGSEIHAPLALVVLLGLASSTLLNMLVVPTVFWRWHRAR